MSIHESPPHVAKAMRFEYPHLKKHAERKSRLSHRTIFYMKEYGPHSHVVLKILKESLKVLIPAVLISSFGGLTLDGVKGIVLSIAPFVILFPALNDMIGDFGSIVSSRVSTMLYKGKLNGNILRNLELQILLAQILIIALAISVLASIVAIAVAGISGFISPLGMALKIIAITLADVLLLVIVIFVISVLAGIHFYRKGEDPNNFLIPIVTSIADFSNILILSALIILFF